MSGGQESEARIWHLPDEADPSQVMGNDKKTKLALDALNGRKNNVEVKKSLKSTNSGGLRTVSWGENSSYAGVAALLKPTVSKQLDNVKRCLRENMVPFTERHTLEGPGDVELLVLGSLIVSHPYTADSCSCPNEIVLARIRELIAEAS